LLLSIFIHFEDGCLIATPITVIRGTENRHHGTFVTPIVSLHDELMRSCHGGESVALIERGGNVGTKRETGSPRRNAPTATVVVKR
jgi:hypothetical protein